MLKISRRISVLSVLAVVALAACDDYESRLVTATQDPTVARVAPAIDTQPQAVAVAEGQTAMFFVQVSGRGPVTYQWHRNGVAIAGATRPVHQIHAATLADDQANYTVVVGNDSGRTTSSAATLIVTARDETVAWK
jgi:Immunoglobulin I-set domain